MRYALGVDSGGSKCEALLVEESGAVVGHGLGGPVSAYYDPREVVVASFREAIAGALRRITGAQVTAAGQLPSPELLAQVMDGAGEVVARAFAKEQEAAYASAQVTWGVVLASGTGSFVHGRTAEGRDLHFGGLGPTLGDEGSAYAIGLAGLRAAYASSWTASRRTTLATALPRALEAADLGEVFRLVYVERINRRRIASLRGTVDAEAEQGDAVARRCVLEAADDFAASAADLIQELELSSISFPLLPVGSVARGSRLWWERVLDGLHTVAPQAYPLVPRVSPAAGAALIALREMGVAWTEEVVARLEEGAG